MTTKQRYGLVLDLDGAPSTPHNVPGFQGYFRPDIPTPVGEEGQIPLNDAKKASGDEGVPLKLVELKATEVSDLEKQAAADVKAGRKGLIAAQKDNLTGAEVARAKDEKDSTKS